MAQSQITKVWGIVDGEEVEFRKSGEKWVCGVAPDFSDGTYSCSIFAQAKSGAVSVWFGFLYMCSGICHFEIDTSPVKICFTQTGDYGFEVLKQNYEIEFIEECEHFDR